MLGKTSTSSRTRDNGLEALTDAASPASSLQKISLKHTYHVALFARAMRQKNWLYHSAPSAPVPQDSRSLHGSTMRLRIAYRTSAAGEESLSLCMMAARCVSTVLTLIFNRPAICLLV